jgi:hypothetical protein
MLNLISKVFALFSIMMASASVAAGQRTESQIETAIRTALDSARTLAITVNHGGNARLTIDRAKMISMVRKHFGDSLYAHGRQVSAFPSAAAFDNDAYQTCLFGPGFDGSKPAPPPGTCVKPGLGYLLLADVRPADDGAVLVEGAYTFPRKPISGYPETARYENLALDAIWFRAKVAAASDGYRILSFHVQGG